MARGRKPKSPEQRMADGSYDPARHGDMVAAEGAPQMPDTLTEVGQQVWRLVVKNWMGEVDAPKLEMLCRSYELWRQCDALITDDPTDKDTRIAWKTYADTFDKLGMQFGLSPADRGKLRVPSTKQADSTEQEYFGVVG